MLPFLVLACAPPQPVVVEPVAEGPQSELVIAHTNDLHAHFLPEPAGWLEGEPATGESLKKAGFVVWTVQPQRGNKTTFLNRMFQNVQGLHSLHIMRRCKSS